MMKGWDRTTLSGADIADESVSLEGGYQLLADNESDYADSYTLWPNDAGTLPQDARAALLRLVKGPYISEAYDGVLWRALLGHMDTIRSRLADLFLDLYVDAEAGIAFVRNVSVDGCEYPKATSSLTMTLLDTIMALVLRKELLAAGGRRVFIGQTELFEMMQQYRPITKKDPSAFVKSLDRSWGRLVDRRMLVSSDVDGRFEISPVLKLVFGAEEAAAVYDEFEHMTLDAPRRSRPEYLPPMAGNAIGIAHENDAIDIVDANGMSWEEGTLFDGLL